VGDLFNLFKARKETFAIVIDEYGGLAGIISMRDVIQEIVGEIHEGDVDVPQERIRKRSDGSYAVSGDTPLSVLAEITGGELPNLPYVQTVAGFIAWALDRIPVVGDTAETALGRFTVIEIEANRVEQTVYRPGDKSV